MKRIFLALTSTMILAGLLVALSPTPAAQACSCAPSKSAAAYANNADAVFTGSVTDRYQVGDHVTYVLGVQSVYQGAAYERQAVRTHRNPASCGIALGPGKPYAVFADSRDGGEPLAVTSCGGTRNVADLAFELREVGEPTDPRPGDSPGVAAPLWHPARWIPGPTGSVWPTVLAGVGAGGLVGGVVVLVRRRER